MEIQQLTALVVDDVGVIRNQIIDMLLEGGVGQVLEATNGLEAMDLIVEKDIDFIICDLYMNPVGGEEVYKYVRSFKSLNGTPFLMLSAENTSEKVEKIVNLGVDDYVLKPFKPKLLMNRIKELLYKKGKLS